ncbi:hypothetical protein K435DRAFT_963166 [Dendrothele bispora CBS 962.96]|uniref:snRNA-activating protein complex subunit 3 n=1 Tax=Dendrothele bispora (strain CBS 962.96) TaxID=1314807 RepID=A0A4S8MJS2_DENBC|nr:hypothetical protein K435DRAFT_963166 [Dendrothele bispora CBS 962.96]
MDAKLQKTLTSQFGPPSEPIDVGHFVQDASNTTAVTSASSSGENEYSVDEIKNALSTVWNDAKLSAYLSKTHDDNVTVCHGGAKSTKARSTKISMEVSNDIAVKELQNNLDGIKLASWKLHPEAALFTRPPRTSDHNTITQIQITEGCIDDSGTPQAVIIFSVHVPVPWRTALLTRSSMHAILSSQTLGDLFEVIPCESNNIPDEFVDEDGNLEYKVNDKRKGSSGHVICIDELAYGDAFSEDDYADKLLQHLKIVNSKVQVRKADTATLDTPLSSLSLKINHPYWLLHQGSCEHFIVIEHIRMKAFSDPTEGFPLTLQITPSQLDICRACAKTPAIWAITGDIRLAESPCLLCGPCWRVMGNPVEDDVTVIPLPTGNI